MQKINKTPLYLALILALGGCGGGGGGTGNTGNTGGTQTSTLSGKAVDGYIKGATVFCDANNNGVQDPGEVSAITGDQGDFTLGSACASILVGSGGTDISTGYAFKGVLKAPSGAKIVSPLTTLLADSGLTNAQLVKALSLPQGTDLTQADPVAPGNAAIMKKTLAAQQIVQQMANLMGTETTPAALSRLYTMVAKSLASALVDSPDAMLFDANGSANTALIAAAIKKTVVSINNDNTLKPVSFTVADVDSVATQLGQQSEQFAKANDADLADLAKNLQNPLAQPVQTETAKAFYIAPKNDSVTLNGSAVTLSQFNNPGVTVAGLKSIGFEYTAPAGTQVDVLADVGMALEEVNGQGRALQVKVEQVRVERDATSGIVKLSVTPQTNVYVYAKDSRGNEFSATVTEPAFNPLTIVNNAVTVRYDALVEKVVGNSTYNNSSFVPSQFLNLTGSFKAKFVVSNNLNVRYQDGTRLPVLSVGIANTSRVVTGPGTEGILNIQ